MMPRKGAGAWHIYNSKGYFGVSSKIWRDSSFPFTDGDKVSVSINGDKSVTITKFDARQRLLDDVKRR